MAKKFSRPKAQFRKQYVDPLPSKTDQSFRQEVNVNSIMDKYRKGQQITHVRQNAGIYADVSNVPDLAGAFEKVRQASSTFATLPAEIRERLNNDPRNLEGFLVNPANKDLAMKYGLIQKKSAEVPSDESTKVPPATPASPPAADPQQAK